MLACVPARAPVDEERPSCRAPLPASRLHPHSLTDPTSPHLPPASGQVALPLGLHDVAARLRSGYYRQAEALASDVAAIAGNAAMFNGEDSELAEDAAALAAYLGAVLAGQASAGLLWLLFTLSLLLQLLLAVLPAPPVFWSSPAPPACSLRFAQTGARPGGCGAVP